MRATFNFNLYDPDDKAQYDVMNQASKMQRMLWEFSQQLREWEKYGHQFNSADNAVYSIREEFYKMLNNYEINIDL
jgi:phage-related tail protein